MVVLCQNGRLELWRVFSRDQTFPCIFALLIWKLVRRTDWAKMHRACWGPCNLVALTYIAIRYFLILSAGHKWKQVQKCTCQNNSFVLWFHAFQCHGARLTGLTICHNAWMVDAFSTAYVTFKASSSSCPPTYYRCALAVCGMWAVIIGDASSCHEIPSYVS